MLARGEPVRLDIAQRVADAIGCSVDDFQILDLAPAALPELVKARTTRRRERA